MAFTVIQAIMILLVTVSLVALAFPWVSGSLDESIDIYEVGNIKTQFEACSDRILETARTGTVNRCIFNIERGTLVSSENSLTYRIASNAKICDPHPLIEIDERKHIWQNCSFSNGLNNFEMHWMFPSYVFFDYASGEVGNSVELSRYDITPDNVTLRIRIY